MIKVLETGRTAKAVRFLLEKREKNMEDYSDVLEAFDASDTCAAPCCYAQFHRPLSVIWAYTLIFKKCSPIIPRGIAVFLAGSPF